MRRLGLAMLLVLVLGPGVAAQSPSPGATPAYAPDDIGSAVPRRIGTLDLYVRAFGAEDVGLGSDPADEAYWRDFLAARDKGPADMEMAYGIHLGASDPALELWALRVTGIAADELIDPVLVTSETSDLSDMPPGGHADWRDFAGHRALVLAVDGAEDWRVYYPRGEVLFIAYGDDRAPVEDVLTALEAGIVAPSPSPPALPTTSPEPTPPFAPDDLGALLPVELGGVRLTVEERTGAEAMAASSDASTGKVSEALLPLGADPADMSSAIAFTTDASAPEQYHWSAWRVPGVPAEALFEALVQAQLGASGQTIPTGFAWPRQTIHDRAIISFDAPDDLSWQAFYLKGEVLFILQGQGGVTLADAVAVLP